MTIKCSYGKQIWNMGSHHGMSSDSEHELNPDIAIDSSYCREVKKNKKLVRDRIIVYTAMLCLERV